MRREDVVRLGVSALAVAALIWLSLTSGIQGRVLGVVLLALVVWSLYPERHLESSIAVVVLLALFEASLSPQEFIDSLFRTYGGSGLWIILSGFVLAKGMETSGLARRIALMIATSLGGNPRGVILAVAAASLAVAPLSPSTTAKAFLMLPICTGLVEAFGVEKGRSGYGVSLMLVAMAANNVCSTAFLTATVPNPISVTYLSAAGVDLDWGGWLKMALPPSLILLAASYLLATRMFRSEVSRSGETLDRIREMRRGLGRMNRREVAVAALFSAVLLLWVGERYIRFNVGLISLALSLILFLPRVGAMNVRGFSKSVPWGSIALFAASMFMAGAVERWRALDPVAEAAFNLLGLDRLGSTPFVIVVILFAVLLHVAFTSTTVYATVMVPLTMSLAQLQGIPPQLVGLPVAFLVPVAVVLPVNTIPNIIFYKEGWFNQRQIVIYGLALSLVSVAAVLLVGIPYWRLLGLI